MLRPFLAAACLAATLAQAAPAAKWTITDILPAWGGQAEGINNRGEVTGWMYGSSPIPGHVAFIWSSGQLQNLGVPAGEYATQGFGISNNGLVVGDTNQRPAVWQNGQWTVVSTSTLPLYGNWATSLETNGCNSPFTDAFGAQDNKSWGVKIGVNIGEGG